MIYLKFKRKIDNYVGYCMLSDDLESIKDPDSGIWRASNIEYGVAWNHETFDISVITKDEYFLGLL